MTAAPVSAPLMSERRVGLIGGLLTAIGPVSMALYTPAMPAIVESLGTTQSAVKLTLALYFGGFACGQLVAGPLSDALGRRSVTWAFMGVYCAGSLAALAAPGVGLLMLARFVQGLGASAGVAISRAIVRDLFQGRQSARIMNMIGLVLAIGPAVAPTIGGLVLMAAGWRAIFLLMVGFGIAIVLVTATAMRETVTRDLGRLRPRALVASYAAVLGNRRFRLAAGVLACTLGSIYAQATFLPFILMDRVGLGPAAFGLGMLLQSGSFILGSLATRRLMDRVGAPRLVGPGLGLVAAGNLALMALLLAAEPSFLGVMLPVGCAAAGIAFVMPAATTAALAPFPTMAGAAAAMLGFLQMGLGLAVGSVGAALGDPVLAMALLIPAMGAGACLCWLAGRRTVFSP